MTPEEKIADELAGSAAAYTLTRYTRAETRELVSCTPDNRKTLEDLGLVFGVSVADSLIVTELGMLVHMELLRKRNG